MQIASTSKHRMIRSPGKLVKKYNKPVGEWQEFNPSNITAKYVRFRFEIRTTKSGLVESPKFRSGRRSASLLNHEHHRNLLHAANQIHHYHDVSDGKLASGDQGQDLDGQTYWRTTSKTSSLSSAAVQVSIGTSQYVGVVRWMYGIEGAADVVTIAVSTDQVNYYIATRSNGCCTNGGIGDQPDGQVHSLHGDKPERHNPIGTFLKLRSGPRPVVRLQQYQPSQAR